jgi:tetratricopeptide (TPR) repeat protein
MNTRVAIILLTVLALIGVQPASGGEDKPIGPLLEGMGTHHHPITTEDPIVQRYFDQGLVLAYGFNHAEAARSFREAIRRDPDCASCYWGLSYVLGPNINSMMNAEDLPEAWKALEKSVALVDNASEQEQAYIRALQTRYTKDLPDDRSHLDVAYADAMREVARRYPKDTDAGTLFAEALMDTTPWDYWRENGKPKPETVEIMETLTAVMDQDPNHPGANHLYIHIVEAQRPEMAVAAADRLGGLVPGAGHLVHMPSHIYIRMGRYHDASVANQKAIAADDDYVTACRKQGLYPVMYMPHNHHFLWAAATIEGRSEVAISAAREIARRQDLDVARQPGLTSLQHYWITPVYALTRFGKWEAILEEPAPPDDLIYPLGVWHYARGMALTRMGRFDQAKAELARLTEIGADPELELVTVWDLNTTDNLIAIAREVLSGEIAAAQGDYETAIGHLEAGVEIEDVLVYDEPPTWHAPVRLNLGAVLLAAGRPAEAEKIYREDLEIFPDNGWALFGLEQSLEAQGKTDEAIAVAGQFKKAWQHADIELASSRL